MSSILVIGAGITGGYTAARLHEGGANVAILARGEKADRIERDGLKLRDGIRDEEWTVRLKVERVPVRGTYDIVMVCVQDIHRPAIDELLPSLPGFPIVWYLGNTVRGYDAIGDVLGRERVLGGFPGVGGTWDGDVLVYADRRKPGDQPFNELIAGEAFREAERALETVRGVVEPTGLRIRHYHPIMAWHWCHIALVLPLAGVAYSYDGDTERACSDRRLLRSSIRAISQGLAAVRANGHPILPPRLKTFKLMPPGLGARKIAATLPSKFGQIALGGHASTAREEMRHLARGFLDLAGADAGADLRELLQAI
jgi:2-dehydropantoate 2-reductase